MRLQFANDETAICLHQPRKKKKKNSLGKLQVSEMKLAAIRLLSSAKIRGFRHTMSIQSAWYEPQNTRTHTGGLREGILHRNRDACFS